MSRFVPGANSSHSMDLPTDDEDSDGRYSVGGAVGGARTSSAIMTSTASGPSAGANNASLSYKERRREAHTQAEQKRRDAIKKGYDYLQELMPSSTDGTDGAQSPASPDDRASSVAAANGGKVSKATVLQKSIDYIQQIQQQKKKQDEELAQLKKEVVALQIMRTNYEQLVKANTQSSSQQQSDPSGGGNRTLDEEVPLDVKFEVFRMLMDSLFVSFNEKVSMRQFSELSACVFSWIEEQCKPPLLQAQMQSILEEVRAKHQAMASNPSGNELNLPKQRE